MTKTILSEAVKELPNEFSIDDLIEKLILLESFEKGRIQYQNGKSFTHEEVGNKLAKWLGTKSFPKVLNFREATIM